MGKAISDEENIKAIEEVNNKIKVLGIFKKKIICNGKEPTHKFAKCSCLDCNHTWEATVGSLKRGGGCMMCSIKNRALMKHVSDEENIYKIKSISPNIEILEIFNVNYGKNNNMTKFAKCKCIVNGCNNEWTTTINSLKKGQGCKLCSDKNSNGAYSPITIERNKEEYLKKDALIYVIRCFNDKEEFIKIGMTYTSKERVKGMGTSSIIKERFGHSGEKTNKRMPYKYEILNSIESSIYYCYYIEAYLHKYYELEKYTPSIYFSGHCECFNSSINLSKIDDCKHMNPVIFLYNYKMQKT